jgi:TolA-binding protein
MCAFAAAGCAHQESSPTRSQLDDLEREISEMKKQNQQLEEALEALKDKSDKEKGVLERSSAAANDFQVLTYIVEERLKRLNDPALKEKGQPPAYGSITRDSSVVEVKREKGSVAVTLDRGARDGLVTGMKICVWNTTEGIKGVGTVTEVGDGSSQAAIQVEEKGKEAKPGDTATLLTPVPEDVMVPDSHRP